MIQAASFEAFRDRWSESVESALRQHLALSNAAHRRLGEAMRYSALSGGKRLRPLLCLLACDACGGDPKSALAPACAVEMVHAYSLIHDDLPCMDNDDLRRGKPTNHKVFGEAMALLAGDALLTHAFAVLASGLPANEAAACCKELAVAAGPLGMAEGQAMDMDGLAPDADTSVLDALYERKTGALIRAALRMGGIVGGGTLEQLAALSAYGSALGVVFQITDDLLDAEASAESAGKAVGKDAAKGKRTYPHIVGVDGARKKAEEYMSEGIKAVAIFADHQRLFRDVADAVLHRDR